MKIQSSAILLNCQHTKTEYTEKNEALNVWGDNARIDYLEISSKAKKMLESFQTKKQFGIDTLENTQPLLPEEAESSTVSAQDQMKITLLETFIEKLTGKKIKLHLPKLNLKDCKEIKAIKTPGQLSGQSTPRVGWGIRYDYQETHLEQERMSFSAQGLVTTKDGQRIAIDLSLTMSREFASHTEVHLRAGDAPIDPLVVNFAGTAAELTTTKFSFDLDANGTLEQISFLKPNSGFLALDQNNDGVINDGSELFGPQSGDGFADLAHYDLDANGWIDENDPIFDRLQIWTKNEQGEDQLFALGQKGIGAIYLGNTATPFAMKDTANQLNGEVQKSGIFLNENGTAGTIQHINLAV